MVGSEEGGRGDKRGRFDRKGVDARREEGRKVLNEEA